MAITRKMMEKIKTSINKKSAKKRYKKKNIVKRKLYSMEMLEKAVDLVKKGKSLRESSRNTGVPISTIYRKLKNVCQNAKSGPAPVLSESIEKDIANWIKERAKLGIPVTKSQLLDAVQSYIKCLKINSTFTESRPGRHWYEGFLRRNTDVSKLTKTPQNLPASRLVTQEDLEQWFSKIESYLKSRSLFNIDSSRVFNCNENSIQLCPKPDKVLSEKGAHSVYKVVKNDEEECISTLFMYSANGSRAPPMVIHKYKDNSRVPVAIANNCPEGWGIGLSKSGRMTTEVFYEYMVNVFYKWLVTNGIQFPVVVYFDGHLSHMTLPFVSFCKEKKIELISLYPIYIHVIQPLDIAFFHLMKMKWKKKLQQWLTTNEAEKITKDQVAVILKTTLDSMKEEKNIIISGFKAAGLVPFDPSQVSYDFLYKKRKNVKESLKEATTVNISTRCTAENFLLNFENDLDPNLKKQFKMCEVTGVWNGDEENKGLFKYWLLKKQSIGEH